QPGLDQGEDEALKLPQRDIPRRLVQRDQQRVQLLWTRIHCDPPRIHATPAFAHAVPRVKIHARGYGAESLLKGRSQELRPSTERTPATSAAPSKGLVR